MTAETANALADAFREHREAFGVAIEIGGATVTAIVNESPFSRELVEGGFADGGEIEVKVLLSDLPALPSLGTAAVYRERSFRVQRVAFQPGGLVGELTLRPAKR